MAKKKMSFEEHLKELEKSVQTLENGSVTLEEMLKVYEKGIDAGKNCQEILEKAKQKITIVDSKE